MDPNLYLKEKLETCSSYQLTDDDKKLLDQGIEEYIYAKLTSKKFRKWKVDQSSEDVVKKAIHMNVAAGKPIQFTFPFGGYKLWRLASTPEVDWAEFFTISYYCQYVAPVVAAYEPGVEFFFSSDDIIIERMDNVLKSDTDSYFASFQKLLSYFEKSFPKNMKMTISRIADLYPDKDEYEKAVNDNLEKLQEEYSSGQLNIDAMLIMSELNVKLDGKEDWTGLSEQEKKDKYVLGALLHHAYTAIPKRRGFVRGEDKIVIFTTPLPNIIAIGTTKTSVTKFWTGMGVLEEREDGYRDRILSPKQWEESQENIKKTVPSDLLSMKNFKKIKISEPLNFTS